MTQIFIVSGTSWAVPSDWSNDNTIETIGGGGGGANPTTDDAGGGGGGAYSKIANLTLTVGANIAYQIGSGGAHNTDGGDTWFNGASLATSSVGAKGGQGAAGLSGGSGGAVASGIGTIKYSGGNGGTPTNVNDGAAGGGGAGGPNGDGANGGNSSGNGGGGGGGAGGGLATAGSDSGFGSSGGQGGTAQDGTAGGAANNSGSHGSGGGGGDVSTAGGPGGNGLEFDTTHGAGGGGGGGGHSGNGGAGGEYGGGAGGGGWDGGLSATGGTGGQGLIVITYTPATNTVITAAVGSVLEFQALQGRNEPARLEVGVTTRAVNWLRTEAVGNLRGGNAISVGFASLMETHLPAITEWVGLTRITVDSRFWLEAIALLGAYAASSAEIGIALARHDYGCFESPCTLSSYHTERSELVTALSVDKLAALEWTTSAASIMAQVEFNIECQDPPGLLLVSPGRLLRSSGRIRILAGSRSTHPLRGV
jgi:hypothetical protein